MNAHTRAGMPAGAASTVLAVPVSLGLELPDRKRTIAQLLDEFAWVQAKYDLEVAFVPGDGLASEALTDQVNDRQDAIERALGKREVKAIPEAARVLSFAIARIEQWGETDEREMSLLKTVSRFLTGFSAIPAEEAA